MRRDRHQFMGDAPTREDGVEGAASNGVTHNACTSPASFPGVATTGDGVGVSLPATAFTTPGSHKRRPVPPHLLVTVAILQAGNGIKCPLCGLRITHEHKRILEHLTPVAFGGGSTVDNLRFVHKACADRKTNGTPATCASGDLHKVAKAKRLEKAREAHRAVLAGEATREPSKIKSRGFPKVHRPMQSRGWK